MWEIRSDFGYHTVLEFSGRFDIEVSTGCESDYVEIQSWNDLTNRYFYACATDSVFCLDKDLKMHFSN